jgi:hypothetical protein
MTEKFLPVLLLTIASTVARAAAAAATPPPDEATIARYHAAAGEARDQARLVRDSVGGVAGYFFRLGAFIKQDLALLKDACEAEAVLYEKIAAAYDRADADEVRALRTQQEKATRDRLVYRERITEYRNRQFLAAPTEQWFAEYVRWYRSAIPELEAWGEARKAAAEAWGRVADAFAPGYDPDAMEDLKERAYALDVEREIGEMRFTWVRERGTVMANDPKGVGSPELTRAIERLQKAQEDRVAAKRLESERERQQRRLDRAVRTAEREFQKAHEAAVKDAVERARAAAAAKK